MTLADGSSQTRLIAMGLVSAGVHEARGTLILQESEEVLPGMDFLQALGLMLVVQRNLVALVSGREAGLVRDAVAQGAQG